MSLQFIIDGYNLIHHPQLAQIHKKTKDSRASLLEFIRTNKLTGSAKNKITVVFDGYPPASEFRYSDTQINVVFTRKDTADERIKKMLETAANPKNVVVVSDDKEIKFFVKATGGGVMGVEEFIQPWLKKEEAHRRGLSEQKTTIKPGLTYSQIARINQELRKIWLK